MKTVRWFIPSKRALAWGIVLGCTEPISNLARFIIVVGMADISIFLESPVPPGIF